MTMNLYQLYESLGCELPMTVVRTTSTSTYWVVKSIGGQVEGPLPGRAPYYGNPRVIASRYQRKQYPDSPPMGTMIEQSVKLPCPGCYQWEVWRDNAAAAT